MPPSDISRTKPLVRLVLNQIGRRLTEKLRGSRDAAPRRHQLLMMLDEFPALGRLDFFETALAFMAGYGVRAFLIAQSLNQIDKAYGENNAILDNCHVRVAFATNDERTAKRISDALGTATEQRAHAQLCRAIGSRPGSRTSWSAARKPPAPLLTPGEVHAAARRATSWCWSPARRRSGRSKLRYYEDRNFTRACCRRPSSLARRYADRPAARR